MPVDMASSRPLRSLARLLNDWAVKKLVGLSSAELTRLPVDNLVWVLVIRSDVCCRLRRFERTPPESTMSDIAVDLPGYGQTYPTAPGRARSPSPGCANAD